MGKYLSLCKCTRDEGRACKQMITVDILVSLQLISDIILIRLHYYLTFHKCTKINFRYGPFLKGQSNEIFNNFYHSNQPGLKYFRILLRFQYHTREGGKKIHTRTE